VLNGQLEYGKFNKDSILVVSDAKLVQGKLSASEEELELRKEVAKEEKLAQPTSKKTKLKGKKNKFNVTDHYPTAIK
jgi:hypothetical protein